MGFPSRLLGRLVRAVRRRYRLYRRKRHRTRHLRLGKKGENLCCRALCEIGVEVLCRNYRNGYGEIDIIGLEGTVLCFIEVKTRHRRDVGRPADAVDMKRRRRYGRCAARYLNLLEKGIDLEHRFDIMEVLYDGSRLSEIRFLRGAFWAQFKNRKPVSGTW